MRRYLEALAEKDAVITRQAELIANLRLELEAARLCSDESAQIIVLRGMLAEERRMATFWQSQTQCLFNTLRNCVTAIEQVEGP